MIKRMWYSLKNLLDFFRAFLRGYSNSCRIEKGCVVRNTLMEGQNHVGKHSVVFNSRLGYGTGISRDSIIDHCIIERYSALGPDIKVISGQHPTSVIASIHPSFYSNRAQMGFTYVKQNKFKENKWVDEKREVKVHIGNDVWIGSYVRIMEGITIGDGAIVAAGAIVTKDIPPYAIVGGVPAKIIKYRFDEEIINKLLELKWWNKDKEWIQKHADDFENVEILLK